MPLRVAVQMDPLETINIAGDSTFALMLGAQARGHKLYHYLAQDLTYQDGRLYAGVHEVSVQAVAGNHFSLGPFSILDYKGMREATMAGLKKTGVKIPNIHNTIQNMSGGQRQCVAIARTATFHSKLTIMDEPTAALGVQETAQVENIIRTLKEQGEPLILISHNMRQVMELCDRIVVWRRGRICANLRKEETDGQDVVAYITGAKTQAEYASAA